MSADLHIHTTASDGQLTPRQVIDFAIRAGLNTISITDHDTVAGYLELYKESIPLQIIPGIELSTNVADCEVHILGYYVDVNQEQFAEVLQHLTKDRFQRAGKIIRRLHDLGFFISQERVAVMAGNSHSIGRPHIARALVEQGYFASIAEVFQTVLATNGPAYVPHYKLLPKEAIKLIQLAGGLAVLAHPGLIKNETLVKDIIGLGIDGLEAIHPKHTSQQLGYYQELAQTHRLLITGGSDFHGIAGRYPEMLGKFSIPSSLIKEMEFALSRKT